VPSAPIKVNWQLPVDADNKLPAGYIPDVGLTYRYQNGYTYGESEDRTGNARNREEGDGSPTSLPDGSKVRSTMPGLLDASHQPWERYDTTGIQSADRDWAIELAPGTYLVELIMGDPQYVSTTGVKIMDGWAQDFFDEGYGTLSTDVRYTGTDPDGIDNFDWYSATVEITSGILSLDTQGDGKVNFVHITPVGVGRATVTGPVGDAVETNSQVITWLPDPNAISHEVFFGTNPDSMASQGTVLMTADPNDQIDIDTDPLAINTKYYCKVVATTPYSTVNSALHWFTTRDTKCEAALVGDISGPPIWNEEDEEFESPPDCRVDEYDLIAMIEDWLDCSDEFTNCGN
jgi:hypothetical protein